MTKKKKAASRFADWSDDTIEFIDQPRRICAWCQRDMGPANPELEGDSHSICPECQTVVENYGKKENDKCHG